MRQQMKFVSFYLVYFLVWIFTRLPLRWLYCISKLLFYVAFYFMPYRKKLVYKNLQNAFPEWDKDKVHITARKFFRYFCDILVEAAYLPFMSERELDKRLDYKNPGILNDLYNKGKSVIIVMGHYGNWEWIVGVQRKIMHQSVFIYKPLQNKYFDRVLIKNREKYGGKTVPMEKTLRYLMEATQQRKLTMTYFLADQRPLKKNIQYWIRFLSQDTPIYNGPEKIARKLDMAVVYQEIKRTGRGNYEASFIPIAENPGEMDELEIMKIYFSHLEKTIREKPENWLWTHNRWKYNREEFN